MKTLTHGAEMQTAALGVRSLGKRIGFVPTMGALHDGHLSLVRRAKKESDVTVVSIFVNPAQFGPQEDYRKYPRDLERDSALLCRENVDILFAPPVEEMYPPGFQTYVTIEEVAAPLEGSFRPGHFRGVATVVAKLFLLVQPDRAYFGRKDAQQCAVIQQMVRDLNLPIEIIVCPIVREVNGLAMSSRNVYLSEQERPAALRLYQSLCQARELIQAGERQSEKIITAMRARLAQPPNTRIDYIEAVDPDSFTPKSCLAGRSLIALAVRVGSTRLLDNMLIEEAQNTFRFEL